MKRVWRFINVGLMMFGILGGYRSMDPDRLRRADPDAVLCAIVLVIFPAFSLGTVYYSIVRSRNPLLPRAFVLRRPSWDRSPMHWWDDPFQSLFMSTCFLTAVTLGAAARWPRIGTVGFWLVAVYCSATIGLAIGQMLVRRVYRRFLY